MLSGAVMMHTAVAPTLLCLSQNVRIFYCNGRYFNQDINFMRDGNECWKACATVHFATVGEQGIRMVAMKLYSDEVEGGMNLHLRW